MLGNGDVIFLCMQRRMRRWTCVQGTHDTRLGVYMQKPHCHQSYMNGAKAVLWQQCGKHTPCEHKLLIKPGMHGLHNRRCIHCVLLEAAMSPLAIENCQPPFVLCQSIFVHSCSLNRFAAELAYRLGICEGRLAADDDCVSHCPTGSRWDFSPQKRRSEAHQDHSWHQSNWG